MPGANTKPYYNNGGVVGPVNNPVTPEVITIFTATGTYDPGTATGVEVLLVGGGGGGGGNRGAGGGAGGVMYASSTTVPGSPATVTIGSGGLGVVGDPGVAGGDTIFDGINAEGGGGGGRFGGHYQGLPGGSGGGAGHAMGGGGEGTGTQSPSGDYTGYGNPGGGGGEPSGGGGGAGGTGGRAGANGVQYDIASPTASPSNVHYGGGGGGGPGSGGGNGGGGQGTTPLGGGGGSHGGTRANLNGVGQDGYAVFKEPESAKPSGMWKLSEVYEYVKDGEWI